MVMLFVFRRVVNGSMVCCQNSVHRASGNGEVWSRRFSKCTGIALPQHYLSGRVHLAQCRHVVVVGGLI